MAVGLANVSDFGELSIRRIEVGAEVSPMHDIFTFWGEFIIPLASVFDHSLGSVLNHTIVEILFIFRVDKFLLFFNFPAARI